MSKYFLYAKNYNKLIYEDVNIYVHVYLEYVNAIYRCAVSRLALAVIKTKFFVKRFMAQSVYKIILMYRLFVVCFRCNSDLTVQYTVRR